MEQNNPKQSRFARVVVILTGLITLGFGAAFLLVPAAMMEFVELDLTTPSALTEIRAIYGGFQIGLGTFLLICASNPTLFAPACLTGCLVLGGAALGRMVGMVVDGDPLQSIVLLFTLELSGAVLNGYALWTLRKSQSGLRN